MARRQATIHDNDHEILLQYALVNLHLIVPTINLKQLRRRKIIWAV